MVRREKLPRPANRTPVSDISATDFVRHLTQRAAEAEAMLVAALDAEVLAGEIARPERLLAAMRHGALNGGKRLRPFLVIESAGLFGVKPDHAIHTGVALECVHCYSLVHDDLPAMDNADTRRGQPAVHKAFDEATAILAGDGLLTLAFDVIARENVHPKAQVRLDLSRLLARASGIGGMAGGQMLDLIGEGRFGKSAPTDVALLQRMKTGALLRYACIAGAILGEADSEAHAAIDAYGLALGEAFQIADDLLDVEGDAKAMGKQTGQDAALGKATFITRLGVDGAKRRLAELLQAADDALAPFGARADMLRASAQFVATRKA